MIKAVVGSCWSNVSFFSQSCLAVLLQYLLKEKKHFEGKSIRLYQEKVSYMNYSFSGQEAVYNTFSLIRALFNKYYTLIFVSVYLM